MAARYPTPPRGLKVVMDVPDVATLEQAPKSLDQVELSVVIPCLNEAEGVRVVVEKARRTLEREGISGEVIVADNGSEDGSPEIAAAAGARVVHQPRRGYGSAYLAGFEAARGTYVLMGDADDTYDFTQLGRFVGPLREGADVVMGNRMNGNPAGSDALASPADRQPGADRSAQPLLSVRGSAMHIAACAPSGATSFLCSISAPPAWSSRPST